MATSAGDIEGESNDRSVGRTSQRQRAPPRLFLNPNHPPSVAAVSNHPVLLHKLTLMRQEGVPPREFRRLLKEVTYYVG